MKPTPHIQWALIALSWMGFTACVWARSDKIADSELDRRDKIKQEAYRALQESRFDQLEKMADAFRTQKSRLPEGLWKLPFFYEGVREPPRRAGGEEWAKHFRLLEQWAKAKPKSVTPRIALANAYVQYAWAARGGGYADRVAEEGWRLFAERLQKARETLEEAEKLTPKDPEWFRTMLHIALGQQWDRDDFEEMFRRAIALEPSYDSTHFVKATYLLPRWRGQAGDVEEFAAIAADKTKQTEGEALYARIAGSVSWTARDDDFFEQYEFSWPRMKQGFLDIEKNFPNSLWNLNHFCWFACMAGDRETARELFRRIGDEWVPSVWKSEGRFRLWKKWAEGEAEDPPRKHKERLPPPRETAHVT
jgi:hypothetical protein